MKTNTNAPLGGATKDERALWQRIGHYPLDNPNSLLPFSRKLAKENQWDIKFAQRAIEEYKKFIFLCCISPHGASPSPVVDKVWHLHLQYTRSYWEEFCEKVLQRKVHHEPSGGGAKEKDRHDNWQKDTLLLYRQTFQQEPPSDIWLPPSARTQQRKPRLLCYILLLPLLLFAITLCSCADAGTGIFILFVLLLLIKIISTGSGTENNPASRKTGKKETEGGDSSGSSSGCSSSGCSSSCGGGCGGGCGGCGS